MMVGTVISMTSGCGRVAEAVGCAAMGAAGAGGGGDERDAEEFARERVRVEIRMRRMTATRAVSRTKEPAA